MRWLLTCCYILAGKANSDSQESTTCERTVQHHALLNWGAHVKRSRWYLLLYKSYCTYCVRVYVKVGRMLQKLILCPGNSVFWSFYCLLSTVLHELKLANSEKHLAWLARNAWAPSQSTNRKENSISFIILFMGWINFRISIVQAIALETELTCPRTTYSPSKNWDTKSWL